jgi:hypothetical protein
MGSRWGPKTRKAVLAKISSNLLDLELDLDLVSTEAEDSLFVEVSVMQQPVQIWQETK